MLLQTNSYIVPRDKREAHSRLLRKFRQVLLRLGCDHFEVYEQVGTNWSPGEATGRYVQIMRFRDRHHQQQVQAAERSDPGAQAVIREFCEMINFPYQQQQGLFATGFYQSAIPIASERRPPGQTPRAAAVVPSHPATPPPTAAVPTIPADSPAENPAKSGSIVEVDDDTADDLSTDADAADAEDCLPGLLGAPGEPQAFISGEIDDPSETDEQIDFDIDDPSEEPTDDDRYPASR